MKKSSFRIMAQMALLLSAILIVVGCSSSDSTPAPNACTALAGMTIDASSIGLGTKGAKVTSATLIAATDATNNKSGVEYCKVLGEIYPVTTSETIGTTVVATPNINFQVNLPTTWNYKTLQLGGGGFDGSIPGLDSATANGITNPTARGYVTLGSDSGHTNAQMPTALWNSESLRNFGRQQIKKTHDVAMAIVKARYGATPLYNYFQGGSQGGHEALIAASFYPEDYDGVIVGYPAYDLEAMHPGSIDYGKTLYNARTAGTNGFANTVVAGGGWISRAQMKAVANAIITVCDPLDGATDNMVSNPGDPVCKAYRDSLYLTTAANPMRCTATPGAHTAVLGTTAYDAELCLSDPQIETLRRITSRYNFAPGITLEGGLKSYGRWPELDGMVLDATLDPGQEDFGSAYNVIDAFQSSFPCTDQVNIITRDATWTRATIMSTFDISLAANVDRVMTLSSWVDTNSVDYSVFRRKGGKMIHYHGSSDVSITPYNSIDLYLRMTGQFLTAQDVGGNKYLGTNAFWGTNDATTNATVSQNLSATVSNGVWDGFYSFYLIPGMGHGKGYYRAAVDWLTALENWVELNKAPRNTLVSTDTSTAHASLGKRPVCAFPYYPKYTGAVGGDTKLETNYTCTQLDAYSNVKYVN